MSGTQILTVALASVLPMVAVLVGILINNSRLGDLRAHMDARFDDIDRRLDEMFQKWSNSWKRSTDA